MKKVLLITTAFVFAFTANVIAQVSTDVGVTADVEQAITLTPADISFGTIEEGRSSYLPANANDETAESENIGAGATAGSLQIEGSDANVTISWTAGLLVNSEDSEITADFTPTVFNGEDQVSSGDNDLTITGGDITLDIGGSLEAINTSGSYSTDGGEPVRFTVAYTDL